jgi:opacity protein-like surface antigen
MQKAARVKKLILFSLIILLTFVSLSPSRVLAQGDNDESEWRKRKGEKEIDTSGSLSLNSGTSFEFSGSFGFYIANYVQIGMESSFEYEETEEIEENESGEEINGKNETTSVEFLAFLNAYLRTKESNPIEPYAGPLVGVRLDIDEDNNLDFVFGGGLGMNLYLTENLFTFLEYRLITDTEIEYSHDIGFGIGYRFD